MPPVSDPAVPPSPEPQITGILQRLARRPYMFLALACLLLWLPGVISLPPLDRDESRFAQSSRQMLQSGDVVDIRFGDVPRYKKPVGIYWAQAAATAIAQPFAGDHHIWSYRLPSLAGGIIAVWLTFWCGALWGGEVGFVAALLMGFSLLLAAEASIATNRNLQQLMEKGDFRKDLYYRLSGHRIHLPPLRERLDDIPLLLDHFLTQAAEKLNKRKPTPPPELAVLLSLYHFPGNVREFRAMVFDAVARHGQGVLSLETFRKAIGCEAKNKAPARDSSKPSITLRYRDEERMPTLDEAETVLIEQALELAQGNQGIAATYLGISRNALNKKIIRSRDHGTS